MVAHVLQITNVLRKESRARDSTRLERRRAGKGSTCKGPGLVELRPEAWSLISATVVTTMTS
jgi:hypothetical protein